MGARTRTSLGRAARTLAAGVLVLLTCLSPLGCASVNIDAKGYRKYWEPFVSPSNGDSRVDQLPDHLEPGGDLACRLELPRD